MEKIKLSADGPELSPLVVGVMKWGVWGADLKTNEMDELIGNCVDAGLSSFDHADIYGHYTTEEAFGKALAQKGSSFRQNIELITKCGIRMEAKQRPENRLKSYDSTKEYIIQSAERSLKNLETDYIDLFLIHRPSPLMQGAEIAAAFEQLKKDGKVRYFGVSNFTPSQYELLDKEVTLVTNQVECSALHTDPMFDGTFDQLQSRGVRPMIWGPLSGGLYFSEETSSSRRLHYAVEQVGSRYGSPGDDVILMAWLLRHPVGMVPIVGSSKVDRILKARRALDINMDQQDWFEILEAARGHEVA